MLVTAHTTVGYGQEAPAPQQVAGDVQVVGDAGGDSAQTEAAAGQVDVAASNAVAQPAAATTDGQSAAVEADVAAADFAPVDNATETAATENVATENVATENVATEMPAWRLLSPPYSAQTPLPASGKAMYYNPGVMKVVIESRTRFDHIDPCDECIGYVAMLRYGDLDRKVWLQVGPLKVEGPFHVVDAAATQHVGMLIERDWVIDVDYRTAQRWGFRMPWVTVWDEPPLDLLLATDAIPLDWETCRLPTQAFVRSPHSVSVPDAIVLSPAQAVKRVIDLRHLGATDFVDAMSDAPDHLYVK